MKKQLICVIAVAIFYCLRLNAQEKESIIKSWQIEPTFNFRFFNISGVAEGETIDFLNYPEYPSGEPFYYAFLGFSGKILFINSIKTEFEAGIYDHGDPALLQFNAIYYPKKNMGISAGAMLFSYLSNDFSSFHQKKYPDFQGDLHGNFQQRTRYYSAYFAGVEFGYPGNKMNVSLKLQAGIGGHHSFEEKIQQKRIHSNYKEVLHYNTDYHLFPVFYPVFEFQQQLIDAKALTMGISFRGSLFYTFTAVDYQRTRYQWTIQDPEVLEIISKKHHFWKADGSLGFYLRW